MFWEWLCMWGSQEKNLGQKVNEKLFRVDQKNTIYTISTRCCWTRRLQKICNFWSEEDIWRVWTTFLIWRGLQKGQIVTLQKFCQEHSQFWETDARSDKSYSVTQFVKEHGCLRHMNFLLPSAVRWSRYRSGRMDFDDPKVFFDGLG